MEECKLPADFHISPLGSIILWNVHGGAWMSLGRALSHGIDWTGLIVRSWVLGCVLYGSVSALHKAELGCSSKRANRGQWHPCVWSKDSLCNEWRQRKHFHHSPKKTQTGVWFYKFSLWWHIPWQAIREEEVPSEPFPGWEQVSWFF